MKFLCQNAQMTMLANRCSPTILRLASQTAELARLGLQLRVCGQCSHARTRYLVDYVQVLQGKSPSQAPSISRLSKPGSSPAMTRRTCHQPLMVWLAASQSIRKGRPRSQQQESARKPP